MDRDRVGPGGGALLVEVHQFLKIINSVLFKSPLDETYGSIIADERYEPAGLNWRWD
jgi:hypothetical protein